MMLGDALKPEMHELIEQKDFATLKPILREMEIHDLTELIESLEAEDLAVTFRLLPLDRATQIFGDLPYEQQEELFTTLSNEKFAAIFHELPPDERTYFLEELPGQVAQKLLSTLRGKELEIARELMAYPENSIGRLMTPEYVAVRPDWTVDQVFRQIRRVADKKETVIVIYVIDENWKLLDEVSLEALVLADPEALVSDLMDQQVISLGAYDDRETAVELFKKYDATVLPVVNSQGVLVGIVTIDDVFDVAEEEDTEDFQKMAGVTPLEQGYFEVGFLGMIHKRLPWLAILLLIETLTVVVMFRYEQMLAILAMFTPLINSAAGNTGGQVAGLMIRGFAVQEVGMVDWSRVLLRELWRGLSMGFALAILAAGIVLITSQISAGAIDDEDYSKALAVAVAMTLAVALANILGSMLPFFFKRVGVDPAVTSGPFIAGLMDVFSILIFFSVATMVLAQVG